MNFQLAPKDSQNQGNFSTTKHLVAWLRPTTTSEELLDLGANDTMRVTNLKSLKVRSRVWNLSERLQTADGRAFDAILAGDTISDDERPRTLLLDTLDVLQSMEVQRCQSSGQADNLVVSIIPSSV